IANGMPLAACIATPEIADAFQKLTISTFGGNPVSCAAANETLRIMEEENLPARVERTGARLRAGLEELQRRHPRTIGDVRGLGLMQAIELVKDETAGDRTPNGPATARLFEETRKRGLLIGKGGLAGNAIRISPPLTVSEDQIDEALTIFRESFEAMEA
ncbi:MAG: aminotransferase class III-fold pyridoxal phosphate-dependent enzyme, partial [Gemmatimonadetes bacterium]|nr:aminotransferase class III-fold pyridoxal phosphate-dependent enzyme [Gemmatimonadota bacterium]